MEQHGRLEEGQRQMLRRLDEVLKVVGPKVGLETATKSPQQQKKDLLFRLFGWPG
jgi:hypothetical protein